MPLHRRVSLGARAQGARKLELDDERTSGIRRHRLDGAQRPGTDEFCGGVLRRALQASYLSITCGNIGVS